MKTTVKGLEDSPGMNVILIVEGVPFLRMHESESQAVRDPLMYLATLPPRSRNQGKKNDVKFSGKSK